jgi:hypothetical protein
MSDPSQNKKLLAASARGSVVSLRAALESGANVESRDAVRARRAALHAPCGISATVDVRARLLVSLTCDANAVA